MTTIADTRMAVKRMCDLLSVEPRIDRRFVAGCETLLHHITVDMIEYCGWTIHLRQKESGHWTANLIAPNGTVQPTGVSYISRDICIDDAKAQIDRAIAEEAEVPERWDGQ